MKTTRLVLTLLVLLSSPFLVAQKLIGYVTEQNSGKKPVADVQIKATGASPLTSEAKGQFELIFQSYEVGENVVIRPEKAGWELVNEKEMKTTLLAKPNESPLKIIMCKAGTLAAAKQAYYKVVDPYIIQEFNLKLAAINKEKASYKAEKAKLQEERNRLQTQLDEYAEEFIRINPDDISDIERRAIALFREGKLDESIKLSESLKSGIEIKKAVKRKAKEDSIIALHTRNLKDLARKYIFKFDFKAAEQKYEELVLADTTNFENIYSFSYFLYKQNQYDKAIQYCQRASKLAKEEPDVARIQHSLGETYIDINEYAAALSAFSKALEIYERLAKTYPATYEPNMALTQNGLGNLYKAKNDYPAALIAYSKALEIFERLAKTYPAIYEPNVAGIQHNLGILYHFKKEYETSFSAYSKALEIYERLDKIYPTTYEPDLANTLEGLGNLYQVKEEYPTALSIYSKTLEIFERLAETNPERFEIEVCRTIVNLGFLQKVDYQSSRQAQINGYLEKAKKILPKYPDIPLAKELMEKVLTDLEGYFKNREILSPILTLYRQSEKEIKNAEKIKIQKDIIEKYRYLVANGYPQFADGLGWGLGGLAYYQIFEKQFEAAEKSAREALNPTIFKKTEDYDAKIEWANTNLAWALLFQGKYVEAEKIYVDLKDKPYNKATYRETFLADLEELENAGITHPDVVKIREMLKK